MYVSLPKIMKALILNWPLTKSESYIIITIVFIVIFSLFMDQLTKPKQDVCLCMQKYMDVRLDVYCVSLIAIIYDCKILCNFL